MGAPVRLTAELVEAFSGVFLSPLYDTPQPTPQFHRECWELYCSDYPQCAIAAPRNHAKSTALTHDYGLAVALFREQDYIIVLGATEEMAIDHLGDIAGELRGNEDLIREFGIVDFLTDQKTDIVVQCDDGHCFRFIARGAEQKIRGKKWHGKRPGLILGDDIEDDEQVESRDRRQKFYRWLLRACKQALRDGGKMRVHGTILHEDSALAKLQKHPGWASLKYKAHEAFDDFSHILWPSKFPESRLRAIRQEFIDAMDAAGYSQEYLNDPFDNSEAYLRKDDFIPMGEEHAPKVWATLNAVGWDFAISKADRANRTSCTVGGKGGDNVINIIDQRVGRMDALEILEEMFSVEKAWSPAAHFVENGQIWKALRPTIMKEMLKRDRFLNIVELSPIGDKAARGRPFQKHHRARAMRFDKQASWYPAYEAELMRFTGVSEALLDDQFDSSAILVKGFEGLVEVEEGDFATDEEEMFEHESFRHRYRETEKPSGWHTGY